MPRYVVVRDFGSVGDDEIQEIAARAKTIAAESFPEIVWQQTHVCGGEDGTLKAFCVYEAPNAEMLKEHTDHVTGLELMSVYEVIGELAPSGTMLPAGTG